MSTALPSDSRPSHGDTNIVWEPPSAAAKKRGRAPKLQR